MLSRTLPFHSGDRRKTFKQIKENDPAFTAEVWKTVSQDCLNLINAMLNKDPKARLSIEEALVHPWFTPYMEYIIETKLKNNPIIADQNGLIIRPRRTSIISDS